MDHMGSPLLHPVDHSSNSTKRKRSPSTDLPNQPTPPAKLAKTHSNHLQINYLARQFSEILPLISAEHDPLPSLLTLIGDYEGVLHRHESMAGNLGARPLGPILIQRFERLFDGPPRVLKMNGKESTSVGWLDVVEFARSKPEQFKLEQTRDGVRVCQFYTKQCRVEISEEDFVLVRSGMPQKLIPPQPIGEDEEKELGTLEILEKALGGCVHYADQVSARARQLNHRIKNRKNAIISRREAEATASEDPVRSPAVLRGGDMSHSRHPSNGERASNSPTGGGFVAVNSRYPMPNDRPTQYGNGTSHEHPSRTSNAPSTNGNTPLHGVSAAIRAELLGKFYTKSERSNSITEDQSHRLAPLSRSSALPKSNSNRPYADSMEYAGVLLNTASPVPIPNTPSSLLPYVKPSAADRFDDSGPFKADMMTRMEQLNRGDRVQPPCDRCRRLHMDCLKNLTACMGCTKKHAKCSWKDVEEQELKDHPFVLRVKTAEEMAEGGSEGEGSRSGGEAKRREYSREQEVRDEELLGEESGDEELEAATEKEILRRHSYARQPSPCSISMSKEPVSTHIEATTPTTRSPEIANLEPTTVSQDIVTVETPNAVSPSGTFNNIMAAASPKLLGESGPSEHYPTHYQAPQAQMQQNTAPERNGTNETNGMNGHVQTEYEKDIYSQLNRATRESAEHGKDREKAAHETRNEEPMRVYIAGSEPIHADGSPVQPMQDEPQQSEESAVVQALNELSRDEDAVIETEKDASTPMTQGQDIQKPQMPSPPLSGVPEQTTPGPSTPVLEQAFPTEPMHI